MLIGGIIEICFRNTSFHTIGIWIISKIYPGLWIIQNPRPHTRRMKQGFDSKTSDITLKGRIKPTNLHSVWLSEIYQ